MQPSDDTLTINKLDVYEQHKELILLGERVVLATLAFDLNVNHPYKPLVEAIKKLKVAHSALAQVAWNFVNDGIKSGGNNLTLKGWPLINDFCKSMGILRLNVLRT
ncbi:unnamed protein product [Prunus armeniaca]|uniref:Cyclin N-terminal domain-containing protein n=1 Tax=Prunus armeniaca TaxID=36596 RepID=A0A6J5TH42_PRUAR|nr:unnamed protein product [Prunus armeniaca]